MCGIAGGLWSGGVDEPNRRLNAALDKLAHRGPDDRGIKLDLINDRTLGLGQTRLSIIDLSSGGHQPMMSSDGNLAIVFNGEIYNYRELRAEMQAMGREFRTASDTEVLLMAWDVWGRESLERLDGMFAFAVFDYRLGRLTCVRDAFGIKPFFYANSPSEFVFASEMPALLELRKSECRPNLQSAYDYLVHAVYDSGSETFVEGVKHLEPGHLLECDLADLTVTEKRCWWSAADVPPSSMSFSDAVDAVRETFLNSIRLQLRSDVPLGAALSGGIDSSAIVCAMRYVEPDMPLHTFSYIADGAKSEEKWVDIVNSHVGAIVHKVRTDPDDLKHDVRDLVRHQGEPFGSTSIYAQNRIYRQAQEAGITVTLDGQGADELMAGYLGYPGQRALSLLEAREFRSMINFIRNWGRRSGLGTYRAMAYFAGAVLPDAILAGARKAYGRDSRPRWLNLSYLERNGVEFRGNRPPASHRFRKRRVTERLAYSLQVRGLPHLLRHGDRNSMAHSIESRVPFLTLPMAKLFLSLPESYLISQDGETKHVFRAAMRGIVPDAILDRRDKIGFETPQGDWFKELSPWIRDLFAQSRQIPLFEQEALGDWYGEMMSGGKLSDWQIWRCMNYIIWYEHFTPGSKNLEIQ